MKIEYQFFEVIKKFKLNIELRELLHKCNMPKLSCDWSVRLMSNELSKFQKSVIPVHT